MIIWNIYFPVFLEIYDLWCIAVTLAVGVYSSYQLRVTGGIFKGQNSIPLLVTSIFSVTVAISTAHVETGQSKVQRLGREIPKEKSLKVRDQVLGSSH